jgi:hypothetical protein
MATAKAEAPRLSDEELGQLLELLRGADSAELKLTLPEEGQRSAVATLGLDPLEAQIRQAFFFDTPSLELNAAGVVVRARRIQGRDHDTVVKLRPVVPEQLPEDLRTSESFNVEVDAMPGGYVCSASFKGKAGPDDILAAVRGERPIRKLFSKEQREFYAEHAPKGIELDDLTVMGPIFVLKLKSKPKDFARKLVAELWLYPDDTRILELSAKCPPGEAFQAAAEMRAFLAARGVDLSGEQQTKTKTALEYFAARK